MSTTQAFLNAKYGAYYHREVPKEDEELTHSGPGTPLGEYFRRFWQPVALSRELQDMPLAIKIMGEELVVFRDQGGRPGLLQLHCSHRGTSLEYGIISERGIRCCYHGWLFDVDGTILETPGEPPESTFKERLCHGAYPVHEFGGLVFAYMGPPDKMPPFPMYDSFDVPGYFLHAPQKAAMPCNWLQIRENSMDPVHTAFLHTTVSGAQDHSSTFAQIGTLDWTESPIGMVYMHCRRVGDNIFVRVNDYISPNIAQVPPSSELGTQEHGASPPSLTIWSVPIDDTNTYNFRFHHLREGEEPQDGLGFGQIADRPYEERQRKPGDYDAQTSQRPVAIHALERLVTSDRGVIMFRRLVRQGIRAVQNGEDPIGVVRKEDGVIPTYCSNSIIRIPASATPEKDTELLRQIGRKTIQEYLDAPPRVVGAHS